MVKTDARTGGFKEAMEHHRLKGTEAKHQGLDTFITDCFYQADGAWEYSYLLQAVDFILGGYTTGEYGRLNRGKKDGQSP